MLIVEDVLDELSDKNSRRGIKEEGSINNLGIRMWHYKVTRKEELRTYERWKKNNQGGEGYKSKRGFYANLTASCLFRSNLDYWFKSILAAPAGT